MQPAICWNIILGIGSELDGLDLTSPATPLGHARRRRTIINRISKLVTTVVASSGLALAGLGLATTASAQGPSYNGGNCPPGVTCTHWLPGQPPPPGGQVLTWDWNVPHDWYWNSEGIVDVTTNTMYPWSGSPHPAAPPPAPVGAPPPPLTPPPGMPFCSPRGALIIIPPICDEIGWDWPPGSLR